MTESRKNPFNLSFGRIPPEYIARHQETDYIVETFSQAPVTDQVFIIMGIRGAGKTVTMTAVGDAIRELDDWIVIKISPMEEILESLLAILMNNKAIHQWCLDAKIEFSLPAVHVTLERKETPRSLVDSIDVVLSLLERHGKKLLVMIDEVTNTRQMQAFSSALQLYITNNRPIYFLGTCLYEEMDRLKNVHNLTFLYRAPKIQLSPLNTAEIARNYQRVFDVSKEQSIEMARFTKGYSYAFQVLGYYCWQHKDKKFPDKAIIDDFDMKMADASYDKLWSELSETDRKVMRAIADHEGGRIKEIYEEIGMDGNKFNQYRRRLRARGLIDVSQYGKVAFALPRFAEYIHTYAYD